MAVIPLLSPTTQPNRPAISPTSTTTAPMTIRATKKQGHPPPRCGGGITQKITFQKIVKKCIMQSVPVRVSPSPPGLTASLNCSMYEAFKDFQGAITQRPRPLASAFASLLDFSMPGRFFPDSMYTISCISAPSFFKMFLIFITFTAMEPTSPFISPFTRCSTSVTLSPNATLGRFIWALPIKSSVVRSSWSYTSKTSVCSASLSMSNTKNLFHWGLRLIFFHSVECSECWKVTLQ
mmetsp:Transcript_36809/g.103852  ORF Transcript_36809/g.103852 Transcript_36809/m.103852 type:complete len:236 (+) Transcript_36809:712-1419(+)